MESFLFYLDMLNGHERLFRSAEHLLGAPSVFKPAFDDFRSTRAVALRHGGSVRMRPK